MTLLFRYLTRNNAFILLPTLAVGIGMYLLTDLFERLDSFIEAGVPLKVVLTYFAVKMPLVISQILPVIFLLSTVIQLCLMARNKELMALQAGGISLGMVARSMLICGLFWGGVQLGFSEYLGVAGERESARIWQEEVHKRDLAAKVLTDQWFADGDWLVSLSTLKPDNTGTVFTGYQLSPDGLHIELLVNAPSYTAEAGRWLLHQAVLDKPSAYTKTIEAELILPLKQNPNTFRLVQSGSQPKQLPIWLLGSAIKQLRDSGSNVENLRTAWHAKVAYAASLFIMAIVATAIVSWKDNIFIAVTLALVCTFLYYAAYTLGTTLGERGMVSPIAGAWTANSTALVLALWRLGYVLLLQRFR